MFPGSGNLICEAFRWYFPQVFLLCTFLFLQTAVAIEAEGTKCVNGNCGLGHHKEMDMGELVEIFGVNHPDKVPSYSAVKVDGLDNIRHDSEEDQTFFIKMNEKQLKTIIRKNKITFPNNHVTEYHDEHGPSEKYQGLGVGHFTRGEIENDELSHVNLHHSGKGISGSVHTDGEGFIIKPLPLRMQNDEANHVVYRLEYFPAREQMKRFEKIINERNSYRPKRTLKSYPRKTVEVTMVADWKMLEFYKRDFLDQYILDLANVIAGLFRDPSLEYPLDLVLIRKVVLKKDIFQATDIVGLLNKFTKWFAKWNPKDDKDPKHADIGILLNRDGCVPGGCDTGGLANMVNCDYRSTCTTVDKGLLSATAYAHELAHVIGAGHDSNPSVGCPTGTFIMSFNGGNQGRGGARKSFKFSPCASEIIRNGLTKAKCYDDVPSERLGDTTYQLYGQVFGVDKQCSMLYEKSYHHCPIGNYEKNCNKLFCAMGKIRSCKSAMFAMLHGTPCGKGKWCIFGECVPDGTPIPKAPAVIDGHWGAWSGFSKCTKPCGVGVRYKIRKCDNPEPSNGGRWCDPWDSKKQPQYGEYETCNTQNCRRGRKILRSGTLTGKLFKDRKLQCKAKGYNTAIFLRFYKKERCLLKCGSRPRSGFNLGFVSDGTGCVTEGKKKKGVLKRYGVCIQGKCKEYGCDFVLHSDIETDRCGVCGGNGTTCALVKEVHREQYIPKYSKRKGYRKILTIPKGADKVVLKEFRRSFLSFGFGFAGQKKPKVMGSTRRRFFRRKGVKLQLRLNRYAMDMIKSKEKLGRAIDIYIKNKYMQRYRGFVLKYLKTLKTPSKVGKTMWKIYKWERCSHTCGGDGIQLRHTYCVRKDDKTPIHTGACKQKRPATSQPCNRRDCPAIWIVSKWTSCSKTCASGESTRTIKCMTIDSTGKQVEVPASRCSSPKPSGPVKKVCNDIECPARWEIKSDWAPCSRSCGGGKTTRTIECWMESKSGTDRRVSDISCANVKIQKPASIDSCNTDEPCPHWNIIKSDCSKSCGNGTQKVSIVCENEIQIFNSSKCNADVKPTLDEEVVSCNLGPCMPGIWIQKKGLCTKSCGGGEMSIVAECQSVKTGLKVSTDQCDPNRKPHVMWGTCNIDECPTETEWRFHYSECSVTCGEGIVKAIPSCENKKTHEKLPNMDCDIMKKPAEYTKPCNLLTCNQLITQLEYHWERRWQDCPVTCGKAFERTKTVCVRSVGHLDVDASYCKDQTPPKNESRPCFFGECPVEQNVQHSWHIQDFGCGGYCGDAKHELLISCLKKALGKPFHMVSPESCNQNEKPSEDMKNCQKLPPCPKNYDIKIHHGICDALCGTGHKMRSLSCFKDKEAVDFTNCELLVTRDLVHPRLCKARKSCAKGFKHTPYLPPMIHHGCWEDETSELIPDIIGKSLKDAEEEASDLHDIKIRSCALSAEKKFEVMFGVDEYGNCLDVKDSEVYVAKKGFKRTCKLASGYKKKRFIYKFFVWK